MHMFLTLAVAVVSLRMKIKSLNHRVSINRKVSLETAEEDVALDCL